MNKEVLEKELQFKAVRSSGPGGQNVNKVATKIFLLFEVENSKGLTSDEKNIILERLASKINQDNSLILHCDEKRSQLKNKEAILKKFFQLIEKSLLIPKKRIATNKPIAADEKRLKIKKTTSLLKQNRKKNNW